MYVGDIYDDLEQTFIATEYASVNTDPTLWMIYTDFIDINLSSVSNWLVQLQINSTFNGTLNYSIDDTSYSICDYCNTTNQNISLFYGYHTIRGIWNNSNSNYYEERGINITANSTNAPSILPSTAAYTTTNLNVSFMANSSTSPINVSIGWYNDSIRVYNYDSNVSCTANELCYASVLFQRSSHHSNITAEVSLTNGWKINSTPKFINNSIPYLDENPTIQPSLPTDAPDLQCNISTDILHDIDNDTLILRYYWYNYSANPDIILQFDDNQANLSTTNTSANEIWGCSVVLLDSWSNSINYTSSSWNLSLSNSPMNINTVNITTNLIVSDSANPTNNNSYILISINTTDPDGDNTTICACKTNSMSNGICNSGSWGNCINTTANITYINYTLGNFTQESNTLYVFGYDFAHSLFSSPKSQTFDINFPPSIVSLYLPISSSTLTTTDSVQLVWNNATDSNNDIIKYIIYLDTAIDPAIIITNTTGSYYDGLRRYLDKSSLSSGTTYYWKIFAHDGHGYGWGNSTTYSFTTYTPPYTPPPGGGGTGEECYTDSDCLEGYECKNNRCTIRIERLIQAAQAGLCGNGVCDKEKGESLQTCQLDCYLPLVGWNADDILNCFNTDQTDYCIMTQAPHIFLFFIVIVGAIGYAIYSRKKGGEKKSSQKPLFRRLKL